MIKTIQMSIHQALEIHERLYMNGEGEEDELLLKLRHAISRETGMVWGTGIGLNATWITPV